MKSVLFLFFAIALLTFTGTAQDLADGSGKGQQESNIASLTVVINEIYGAGGCNTANCSAVNRDYIELRNVSATLQNISGWSVQYASATGTTWQVISIPAGTILRPGDTYLIGGSTNGVNGTGATPLPTPNISTTLAMSGTAGKVALVSNSTAISGAGCPIAAPIVDYVGYGATANCSETAPAPAPTATTSIGRTSTTDTDANSVDFTNAAPTPTAALQPTAATAVIEGRVVNASGSGISKVTVTVSDSAGRAQTFLTGGFGYFSFEGLQTGETYIVTVSNKRYEFNPASRAITLTEDLRDLEFRSEQ